MTRAPGSPTKIASRRPGGNFRAQYDALEKRRTALLARLAALRASADTHPAFKSAQKLLNDRFRKSSLVQRASVLQAADWLIGVLDLWTKIG